MNVVWLKNAGAAPGSGVYGRSRSDSTFAGSIDCGVSSPPSTRPCRFDWLMIKEAGSCGEIP